jgi:putative copper resistance protein D
VDPLLLVRAVHIAATAMVAGAIIFQSFVIAPAIRPASADHPTAMLDKNLRMLVWAALAVALLSGLAWLMVLSARFVGQGVIEAFANGVPWTVLTATRFGHAWAGRLAIAVLLAGILFFRPARDSPERRGWIVSLVAACFLGSLAWSGHAGASPGLGGTVHLASDVLHLVAVGAWIGALPPLAMLLLSARQPAVADFVAVAAHRFSVLGMLSVGTLIVTGIINTWNLSGTVPALLETDYGRLLLLKVSLFVVIVGVAAVNRLRLVPRLPDAQAVRSLRRNALIEIAIGATIILIVGGLGTMPPGAHAAALSHVH